jgi:hypothetical protein
LGDRDALLSFLSDPDRFYAAAPFTFFDRFNDHPDLRSLKIGARRNHRETAAHEAHRQWRERSHPTCAGRQRPS